ncbi:outer membrane protein assembly factor BamD [Alphaproteobacteria bacterium]|nr:outer membrane protein assembly factor BamD [Alphaproteobacteria bacterium]
MKFLKIFFVILLLSNCSAKEEKSSAETLYLNAYKLLKNKDYSESAKEFEKIDDEFPFSKWALKGQVMAGYSYFKEKEFDKVINITEDFVRLNPVSKYVPYMLYLRGLCYYLQIPAIDRSQDNSKSVSAIFRELVVKYPDDPHALDAKEKLEFIDEHIAGSILEQARQQIKQKNFVGAINNLQVVINRYRYTKQLAESYFRLAEIYWFLGDKVEFKKIFLILQRDHQNSYWYQKLKNNNFN